MRSLPATMSLFEVERRAARLRWRLLLFVVALVTLSFCAGFLAIWLWSLQWVLTSLLLLGGAILPGLLYEVIKTPQMVPRMAEHYREQGVKIEENGET